MNLHLYVHLGITKGPPRAIDSHHRMSIVLKLAIQGSYPQGSAAKVDCKVESLHTEFKGSSCAQFADVEGNQG